MSSTSPASASTVTAASIFEELAGRLDIFIDIIPAVPQMVPVPVVLPAGKGFALRDPDSIMGARPSEWNAKQGSSPHPQGPGAREAITAAEIRKNERPATTRTPPGRPYPAKHPLSHLYTAADMDELRAGKVDVDEGSALSVASQREEDLDAAIVEAATAAGVKPGLRLDFVLRFVAKKLAPIGYFLEPTDEARTACLGRCVKNAVAAASLKEELFASYDAKIAAAERAEVERDEAPEDARIGRLDVMADTFAAKIAALEATVAQLSARVLTTPGA